LQHESVLTFCASRQTHCNNDTRHTLQKLWNFFNIKKNNNKNKEKQTKNTKNVTSFFGGVNKKNIALLIFLA